MSGQAYFEETNLVTDAPERDIEYGAVKFVNREKGFLFVIPDWKMRGQQDVFGHISQVLDRAFDKLEEHTRVSYKLRRSRNNGEKLEAYSIRIVERNHG